MLTDADRRRTQSAVDAAVGAARRLQYPGTPEVLRPVLGRRRARRHPS
ncbi:hypothetical protein HBB16_07925 [Pseudonocardia sp. MCCB 268]|nr:hypothetical protein [Pseudonocardia cytotoxica]